MKDRNVIQVISTGGFYGAERVLLELSEYLAECNWNVHVVALEGAGAADLVSRAKSKGLSAELFGVGRVGVREQYSRLRAVMKRLGSGIVHSHGYKPDLLLSIPPRLLSWARISTCHTWYSDTWKMRLWESLDKTALRKFEAVVAVSNYLQDDLLQSGVGRSRIHVINNGIEVSLVGSIETGGIRDELNIKPGETLLVQTGRLARSKRADLLLDAVTKLPTEVPVKIALVGEGPEKEQLIEKARHLGIAERVHFLGYRRDVNEILSSADILVLPSDHEGLPIVILEAMAIGCPIVATKVGAIPNVLTDGETALLVPPGDAQMLSMAITKAIGEPGDTARRAAEAKKLYTNRYSRRAMGKAYAEIYKRILEPRSCKASESL